MVLESAHRFGARLPILVKSFAPGTSIIASLALAASLSGCSRTKPGQALPVEQRLDAAVQPAALVASLRRLSGGHFHATAMFRVSPAGAPDAGGKEAITTTTDLWLDQQGNFRLVESNDQEGGREVVRVGPDLAVALRPGPLMKRPAQDPEPQRFLEEAVGQPFAAWDTVGRFVEIAAAGEGVFKLSAAANPHPAAGETTPLRKWRETIEVQTLSGEARIDAGGLQAFALNARWKATREAVPIEGEIGVTAKLDQVGAVPPVIMPAAETPALRQRTILEERALLTGLGGRTPPPAPSKKRSSERGSSKGSAGQPRKPATNTTPIKKAAP
jgi:hypothetical protein